ncbi:putative outer membrane starch-binding protein [Dysgonomonas alginatilytica]|uniref:Putative outer membrane starch-binding protein n=1 Tax=Dysgonomonas alginatilytica TaxID=1605892 RepID=A0A2V3PPY7_9BACT|nr:RagB/SusD family nutrient uptake outer membrane protein [Dysgonomonas alginatilytica]PXV63563.1 putative outer membrane starch-binding protein [Dysgonomonas alginatilytica]
MRKIILLMAVTLSMISCEMDYLPNDKLTPEQMEKDPSSAEYVTEGNYSMFKNQMEYQNETYSGNTYVRHYFQMSEFIGDNVCLAGRTSDPLYEALTYKRAANLYNINYLWWCSYKIINGASSVIESVQEGASVETDHLKGENYFIRAIVNFHLSTLWSKHYSQGRDNIGIVIRKSSSDTETKRATVGEAYDLVVSDLENAIRLMSQGKRRGNAGYISKEAAQGLLSRVYLYMGENEKVISVVNEMLAGNTPDSKLEPSSSFPNYFAKALSSVETLWAVAHTNLESRGASSIGSMYFTAPGPTGGGWGEIYASDPLLDLYERNKNDLRYGFISPKTISKTNYMIRWAIPTDDDFYQNELRDVTFDAGANKYYFMDESSQIYVEKEKVNGYEQNYINFKGEKLRVRLSLKMENRYGWPKYFVTKFSYQDGDPMLSSPVMLRWGEVILNRAEAYAKTNNTAKALDDVNTIRKRAGLSGNQLFSTTNMQGYSNVLDVVLDERRLELAFEGHRAFDIYRNKLSLDRRYSGVQPWEVVEYSDNRLQYLIPLDEITTSGIPQNP